MSTSKKFLSDEEKAEININSASKFDSEHDIKGNSHQFIAISPDGTHIVTLSIENYENYQLILYKSDNLSKPHRIICNDFRINNVTSKWSLAVSNEFTLDDKTEVLIAASCFNDDGFNDDDTSDNMVKRVESTWIISTAHQSRIYSSIDNIGGVVKFLDRNDEDDNTTDTTNLILINANGITKFFINHGKNNYNNICLFFLSDFFSSDKSIEKFYLPKSLSNGEFYSSHIQRSLVKGRFVVNRVRAVEMYNLKTNLLENTFQKHEESAALTVENGLPCFAISNNEYLFACCHGANSITIYLMENGLEVATKKFIDKWNVHIQILFFDFVQDDSKLLIFIEEESYDDTAVKINVTTFIVVWDLFSNSDNNVRRINDTSLFPLEYQRLANASEGNLIIVTEDGNIVSLLKEEIIIKLLENDDMKPMKNTISLNNIFDSETLDNHMVYDFSGECLNSHKTDINEILIIKNPEPWVHNKNYTRTSIYLYDNKSIQLIIGESTVQVWKKSSSTRDLKYIWVNGLANKHMQMQITSLEIGHKEFSLILYIPSGISPQLGHEVKIEWPEKVNNVVDACQALEFLNKKKDEPLGPTKQFQLKDSVHRTERILKKYSIKNYKKYGLWKMLDIRFDIMANLIRGNCVFIIKNILSSESNGKNKYLHIPRSYSWDQLKKETDLEIAIKCTEGGYRKDTIIVKYLLDYYSDNAIKNPNWMSTVSKAIPLLYRYHLNFYVEELFRKPCFGTSKVYLENYNVIHMNEVIQGNVRALSVNLDLIKKKRHNLLRKSIDQGKQR